MARATVAQLVTTGARQLAAAGIDSAPFDAGCLLAHALQVDMRQLAVMRRDEVKPEAVGRFRALLARRATREPLQYITGDTEFYGLPFRCDARAMVPRPDTETLVQAVIDLVGTAADRPVLADIGAGTGIIAISLAYALPNAVIYASDLAPEALSLAEENIRWHRLTERITLLPPGPYLGPLTASRSYEAVEVVVCNPPYIESTRLNGLQPEVRTFEPRLALDGGRDGLDAYRQLLPECRGLPRLRLIALEVGEGQAEAVTGLSRQHFPSGRIDTRLDLNGIVRVVLVQI